MRKRIVKISPFYSELVNLLRITPAKIFIYLFLIVLIELQTVWLEPVAGAFYFGILLIVMLHHYLLAEEDPKRGQVLLLASIPLLRLLSMAMPVGLVPPLYRYSMVGIPVLAAVFLMVKQSGVPLKELGLRMPEIKKGENFWENILIAVSGIPLGIFGYYFADPIPLISSGTTREIIFATLMVFIFIGALEEIVFRGLLLQTLNKVFGKTGIIFTSLVYLAFFTSSQSIGMIGLMGFVSLLFSWHVLESKSILAVTISHSLMFVSMLIFCPLFL